MTASAAAVPPSTDRARGAHWALVGRFLRPHARALLAFGVLVLIAGTVPLAGPVLLGAIADSAVAGAGARDLVLLAVGFAAVGLAAGGSDLLVTWLGARLAWTAANDLRVEIARHALSLGPAWHGRTTPGAVVDRVDGDATRLGELLARVVVRFAASIVTLVGIVALLWWQEWRLGAAMAVLLIIGGWVLVRLKDLAVPAGIATRETHGAMLGAAEERLRGAEELRALGAGRYAADDLHRRSALTLEPERRLATYSIVIWAAAIIVVFGGGTIALGGGIALQRAGVLTVGQVLLAFTATQLTRRPLEALANHIEQIQQAAAGAARLAQLVAEQPLVRFTGDAEIGPGPLSVDLVDVTARYPGADIDVLGPVDVHLAPGTRLGVVGASGGGKTTMSRLLHRSLDPRTGTVRIGGLDLRDVAESSLRDRVAVVTQEVQLMSASVRDNLTLFGAVTASDEALTAAVEAVGLGTWLSGLEQGLDAHLGSDAGTSAGEAQLLALARVLLRDPGLVVLDEPTARLDTASALAVTEALDLLLTGRTAVVIAHRMATLEHVDEVAVVRDGQIVEHGERADLAASDSRFAAMVAADTGAS